MKSSSLKKAGTVLAAVAMAGVLTTAQAIEPTVITFDDGTEGWSAGSACATVVPSGGNPGAYWNAKSYECGSETPILSGWFLLETATNPAFVGDFGAKGPVRLSIDVDVIDYTYYWFGSPVEEYRQVVFEFIDYDNPYTDPETGYFWPWTSVIYTAGYLPNRDAGWKTFIVDIPDPDATELPEGWVGFGGPETPPTYMPQLPPGRTFANVLAEIDAIQIHNIEPGFWYDYGHVYDVNFDNLTIKELPRECDGREATVWVDRDGMVHGGEFDGMPYAGELVGTQGDDVIVGTDGDDTIQGLAGNDLICGEAGNDALHGHFGNDFVLGGEGDDNLTGQRGRDFLDGGDGRDTINGGPNSDTCINGEVVTACGEGNGGPRMERTLLDAGPQVSETETIRSFDRN